MSGNRDTRHLTSVELGIMRECVSSLNPAQLIGFSTTDSKGNQTQGAVAGRGDPSEMASNAAEIVKGMQAQMDLAGGENRSDSDGDSGDVSGVASDFVQGSEGVDESGREDGREDGSDAASGGSDDDCKDDEAAAVATTANSPEYSSGGEE